MSRIFASTEEMITAAAKIQTVGDQILQEKQSLSAVNLDLNYQGFTACNGKFEDLIEKIADIGLHLSRLTQSLQYIAELYADTEEENKKDIERLCDAISAILLGKSLHNDGGTHHQYHYSEGSLFWDSHSVFHEDWLLDLAMLDFSSKK